MKHITLTVDEQMFLSCPRQIIGYEGDVNAVHFTVMQPKKLAGLSCRVEIEAKGSKTFIPVIDRSFTLPVAAKGEPRLQLIYTGEDGDIVSKTNVVALGVDGSVNALDPASPGVPDTLTQILAKAVGDAEIDEDTAELVLYNLAGEEKRRLELPASGDGTGKQGPPGNDGKDGAQGPPGNDGLSAYEIAVNNGFTGTEAEWLESLKGADGQPGDAGFSPVITVAEETAERYALNILTSAGEIVTPNLKGADGKDGQIGGGASDWAEIYINGRPTIEILTSYGFAQVPLTEINTSSTAKFSAYDGGLKIGAGVKRVKVSTSIVFLAFPETSEFGITLSLNHIPASTSDNGFSKQLNYFKPPFCSFAVTPKIIDVVEGDVIYLSCYSGTTGPGVIIGDNGTGAYLTVEEVL